MDPSRFDTLVRTLTTNPSRRRLLGVLSALPLVGTALAGNDEDVTEAKDKRKRRDAQRTNQEATSCAKQCRKKSSKQARRRCRKRCTPPTPECTTTQDCPTGQLCESGICIPIPDQCTVDTDCDECERCQSGVCVARCAPDEVCRGNQCETVQCASDRDCGDCSRCQDGRCRWQCSVTEVCLSGSGGTGRCCQPRSCPAGLDCGTVDDGCGGQARCGASSCTAPDMCGGAGTPNQCGCTPSKTCADYPGQCGMFNDGCDGTIACDCTAPATCGGGTPSMPGVCGCTPMTTCPENRDCGTINDGCGGVLDCGTCTVAGEFCGAGGPNVCAPPQGTCQAGANVCTGTGNFFNCNDGGPFCVCTTTTENTTACVRIPNIVPCGSCSPSSPSCPAGTVCVSVSGRGCNFQCAADQYACMAPCLPGA